MDREADKTLKLSQTAAGWWRAAATDLRVPGRRGHSRGGGHLLLRQNKRAEFSLRTRVSRTQTPRGIGRRRPRGSPSRPGRRRRWSLVSVSRHKGKDLRRHADEPPEAATAGATRAPLGPRPRTPPEPLPGAPRRPPAAPPPREQGAGAAGPAAEAAVGAPAARRHNAAREPPRPPPPLRQARGRHKSPPAAGPRASPAPPPRTDLGLRRRAPAASWSPPSRRCSPAGRRGAPRTCSSPRRRAPGGSGSPTTGTERRVRGGRAPRLPPCRLAPRAPGPPPDWPRPRPARRRAPQPTAAPSSAHPGGFPRRAAAAAPPTL